MGEKSHWIQMFCLKMVRVRYCLIGVALLIKKLVVLHGHCKIQCFMNTDRVLRKLVVFQSHIFVVKTICMEGRNKIT